MRQTIKSKVLDSIGNVYEQSKDCELNTAFFEKVDADLKVLAKYFKVSRNQSFIIAMVFALNYKGSNVELKDLIEYFSCNPMKLLEFSDDFEALYSSRIFIKRKNYRRISLALTTHQFSINEKITEAILKNKPMPVIGTDEFNDVIKLLERIHQLSIERDIDGLSTCELLEQATELIHANLNFPLIKKINDYQLAIEDTYVFIYLIWNTITGNETADLDRTTDKIFDCAWEKVNYVQKILAKQNLLIANGHVEMLEGNFFNDTDLKLSDTTIQMLQELGIKLFANKKKADNIIDPSKINTKVLYFNEFENKQLDLLKTVLEDKNFKETQERLLKKGLPKGITTLLHGHPGTGKTETVFQVAKATDREIVKVEISQSKSMWFGESEKIIKRIFTDYNAFAKDCERMPILFFNEADAIISKRAEANNSPVSKTENTIQNILLEELENFEGIFFATTNLAKNLDLAFERRFLFKIEFQKPDITVKAKIWNSKLPSLTETECELLANSFDFTGGQIDNIVRKNEIHEIIHGVSVDFSNITEFCKTESLSKTEGAKIGFTKA